MSRILRGAHGVGGRREEVVEKSPKAQTKDRNYSVLDPKPLKLTESLQLNCKRLCIRPLLWFSAFPQIKSTENREVLFIYFPLEHIFLKQIKAKVTSIHWGLSAKIETLIFSKVKKHRYDCCSLDADVLHQKFCLIQKPHLPFLPCHTVKKH